MRSRTAIARLISLAALILPAFHHQAEGSSLAPDGIAISTQRPAGGDAGFGVAPEMFGNLVRHDIEAGRVVRQTVVYQGRARGACINFTGDKVAFLKLGGHVCVMNIDGTGFRELTNTRNRNASGIEWPAGDWVYYAEEGASPDGVFNVREKDDSPEKRTIRRVNVLTGEDEPAGVTPLKIWQLSMTANATSTSGRFAITGALLDFSDPTTALNDRKLACGSAVSMNGLYVTESTESHADLKVWDWDLRTLLRQFHVNEWAARPDDGRSHFYRPRWAVNSDRWIVMTHGMDFGCTQQTNMVLYNWRDGRQIQVTNNPPVGQACDEGEDFWLAGMASDLADGMLEGEAPFAVELASEPLAGRSWQWNYGDGDCEQAPIGRHTFSEPGDYVVTATAGNTVLRQSVTVLKRQPPTVTLRVLDDRHVLAEFDEPMTLEAASASLASGTPVAGVKAGSLGRDLLIALEAPLSPRDELTLKGAVDRAQIPNPPVNDALPIVRPAWPANRAGLVFLWETDAKSSLCMDKPRGWFPAVRMNPVGNARFDRNGAMLLEGGAIYASDTARCITERCRATDEWSLEATLTAANAFQGRPGRPRRIIGCRRDGDPAICFSLDQEAGNFSVALTLQTGSDAPRVERVLLGPVTDEQPQHVVVSYAPGTLRGWVNGNLALDKRIDGRLPWQNAAFVDGLHFGGLEQMGTLWRGTIEGVAISSRAVSADDARDSAQAYFDALRARTPIRRIRLTARLAAKAAVPRPEEIAPYRHALVVHEYDVLSVLQGEYAGEKIQVVHRGLVDLQPTDVTRMPAGDPCELLVEPYEDHAELAGQLLRELAGNLGHELFCDVSNGPRSEPRLARLAISPRQIWMPVGMPVRYEPQARDQYDELIDVPLTWSVAPGGAIDCGTAYGAGRHFGQARRSGGGTINQDGLFTGTKAGTATITLSSRIDPAITATAIAGVGDYPAIHPASQLPLCIGSERDAMAGDIDRLRLYARVVTAGEAAASAAGQKSRDDGLIADWTFDERKGDEYANVAGRGLAARVVGQVDHVREKDRTFVRLARKGWLEVAADSRLDACDAVTIEAWVRPTEPGILVIRQVVWMWGMILKVDPDGVMADGFRVGGSPLRAPFTLQQHDWTHLVATFGPSGAWKMYANGKLIGEREAMPAAVR